jgi:hypothetical protein
MSSESDPNRPIWGAGPIGRVVGNIKDGATPEEIHKGKRKTYHQVESGYWDVDRVGNRIRSTPARLQKPLPQELWKRTEKSRA